MSNENLVTEVPSSLKQLARLIVRGFYTIEDALIIDMLVRNPCMKEDDICELLKFERKMLRARIATLKNDKFIQTRLRMETGIDGKAQKINYYFINYKTFVNVVKYKLDIMRKRLETEERDATSRASFKCPNCLKTFTDLEADQLFDFSTQEFRCTYCGSVVEEDQSAMPRQDSRQMMVKFNSQLEPIFILLREVEGIRLAPKVLEPEPVDINTIKGLDNRNSNRSSEQWSGEASRNQGFLVEEAKVDIQFGDKEAPKESNKKERPIWMVESTVLPNGFSQTNVIVEENHPPVPTIESTSSTKGGEDIMSYLLQHERKGGANQTSLAAASLSNPRDDHSDSSNDMDNSQDNRLKDFQTIQDVETLESEEEEEEMPSVAVGGITYALSEIDDKVIAKMTPVEKNNYISVYQDYYSRVYD